MRWNCPHCGIALTVADQKVGAGWTFSRCYQCGGFALIRQPEVNLVKVDGAPPADGVVVSETGTADASVFRNAPTKSFEAKTYLPFVGKPKALPAPIAAPSWNHLPPSPETTLAKPTGFLRGTILPFSIGVVGTFTLVTGFYLFYQAQTLLKESEYVQQDLKPTLQVVDQIQRSAMAPVPPPSILAQPVPQAPEPIPIVIAPTKASIEKEVIHEENINLAQKTDAVEILITPKTNPTNLRSGPGLHFPIVTKVDKASKLRIVGWDGTWFKVKPQTIDSKTSGKDLWVRNDLIVYMK